MLKELYAEYNTYNIKDIVDNNIDILRVNIK